MNQETVITGEFQRAIDAVDNKVPFIFINGGAGTGKSTLTRQLRDRLEKQGRNAAFVAPTGIAAVNINGMTAHSFFKLKHGVLTASSIGKPRDASVYKALDVLFLDEAPMTRCDVIDTIDKILRLARDSKLPFGGVQIVFVGDLYQLPPVALRDDKPLLKRAGYENDSYYFFDAEVFKKLPQMSIELTHIFRQSDRDFAEKLNKIRFGEDVDSTLDSLNKACHGKKPHPLAIVLATTNAIAEERNIESLAKIPGKARTYRGSVDGDFQRSIGKNLPSPEYLELKVGAQVMFTCNDAEGRWFNGSLGVVTALNQHSVTVKLADGSIVDADRKEWQSYEYFMGADKKLKQKPNGSYVQIPLTLAWAITIHKSQGQSLEFLHIDMGRGAFADGQAYVALSRARNIEGMSFESPIKSRDIMSSSNVKRYLGHEEFALT